MASFRWFLSRSAAFLLAASALAGCHASYVDRGAALYAERDYVGADELFEHNETRLTHASNSERARYALYRGVTLLSLGDSARSQYWLEVAARAARHEPAALTEAERATLRSALNTHDDYSSPVGTEQRTQGASASLVGVGDAQ